MFFKKKSENKFKEEENQKKEKNNFSRFLALSVGKEREYFIENLSMLMSAGMSVSEALKSIKKELKSKTAKKIINKLEDDIESGYSLSRGLTRTRIFSDHSISLIEIGEESGRLIENLKIISQQEEKERIFKGKIKSAMMYPMLILSLSIIIGIGIAWFILPKLSNVFFQLDVELPWITKALISSGNFLGEYGSVVIPIAIVVFSLFFYFIFFFSKTKFIGQTFLFLLPGVKRLMMETEIARMGYLMGTLIDSGLPIVSTLKSLKNTTSFYKYKNLYSFLEEEIENGKTFLQCFNDYKKSNRLIPSTIQQMIISGEKSGLLAKTFKKIGNNYEAKIENTTKNLAVLLEPVMLVIVWIGVVGVALAVILPIYSLIGGLNEPKKIDKKPVAEKQIEEEKKIITEDSEEEDSLQQEDEEILKIKIMETGLGFLNVRENPSLESDIVGKVTPGKEYENIGEKEGWYQIIYEKDENEVEYEGWVFGEYAEIFQENQDETENEGNI